MRLFPDFCRVQAWRARESCVHGRRVAKSRSEAIGPFAALCKGPKVEPQLTPHRAFDSWFTGARRLENTLTSFPLVFLGLLLPRSLENKTAFQGLFYLGLLCLEGREKRPIIYATNIQETFTKTVRLNHAPFFALRVAWVFSVRIKNSLLSASSFPWASLSLFHQVQDGLWWSPGQVSRATVLGPFSSTVHRPTSNRTRTKRFSRKEL